ncbi:MAG TPA: maleylpyruvate isomerase family mycothiol-dependent enzyme [Ilumatobacter sp.]|nr:maleylpyruvate isomerase family mycothiol-dependent enzyme [Ilumatobacter sp.]
MTTVDSNPDPSLDDYTAAHEQLLAHFVALARDLTDEQMAMRSLCPDWRVRDVISHIAIVEAVLDGWQATTDAPPPFNRVAALHAELDALDRGAFAERVAEIADSRVDDLHGRDPSVLTMPSFTPTGPATYGRFLQIRVFDHWVHARDIAIPLGLEAPAPSGFAAENAVDEVAAALGYIVGKKIGLPDGMSIGFHLSGGVTRDLAVVVDGRAQVVASLAAPDVAITADAASFVMLACGRVDPQGEIDAGRISWNGDARWGEAAARNLRYTM